VRAIGLFLCASFLRVAPIAGITFFPRQDVQQPATSSSHAPEAEAIPEEQVATHETGNHKAVRLRLTGPGQIFQSVHVTIVVDETGDVVSAVPSEGPSQAYAGAIAEAMGWKYKPFEKDGAPVRASFTDYVRVLPPEELPKKHEPFPSISTLEGVVMTLSRSGCYGTCPAYRVQIHVDGTLLYKGEMYVVVTREHRDRLAPEQV